MVNIERHENRFADMERGREAEGMSGRGIAAAGPAARTNASASAERAFFTVSLR